MASGFCIDWGIVLGRRVSSYLSHFRDMPKLLAVFGASSGHVADLRKFMKVHT